MTEADWFAAETTDVLFGHVRPGSDRKLRLFAVACARRVAHLCPSPQWHDILTEVEHAADSRTNGSRSRLKQLRHAVWVQAAWRRTAEGRVAHGLVSLSGWQSAARVSGWSSLLLGRPNAHRSHERAQAALLRDVVGNPFRRVAFPPKWRTETAVLLARRMYESREFTAMPILADALQDAGCEDTDILEHCRDPQQPHVRGCWVVDLVLGKA